MNIYFMFYFMFNMYYNYITVERNQQENTCTFTLYEDETINIEDLFARTLRHASYTFRLILHEMEDQHFLDICG